MAETDAASAYPAIDPSTFDLIVLGTGLPESILAAAASSAGKSVLHLDPNPFYGSHFSSFPLHSFSSFFHSHHPTTSSASEKPPPSSPIDAGEFSVADLKTRPLYSHIEISSHSETLDTSSRRFSIDLSGPRVLFCADPVVDLMLKSGASHHLEFKSVDASFVYREGKIWPVPDSREGIFKDRSLGLTEKSQLMRFFKLVRGQLGLVEDGGEERRVSEEDLESPFVVFLQKQRLPPKIKSMILYAIAMADYDQEDPVACKKQIKTKDGMESLALYHSSVGRFPNAPGAFIYPIYGQGELPQAFCRCAAVKGALYVLRMPVTSLLLDKEHGHYKGVRLVSGQDLFSHQLVMDPSFIIPQSVSSPSLDMPHEGSYLTEVRNTSSPLMKVARAVCITRGSIQPDFSNLLVVYPPRSLFPEQVTSVRGVQLSSNVLVCPPDLFVIYLSTLCDNADQGKEALQAAMSSLLVLPHESSNHGTPEVNEDIKIETKPDLLWSALYVHDLTEVLSDTVCLCPMPDGNIDYRDLLKSTTMLFHKMYPQEQLFPEAVVSENTEDDKASID
eukprot:TRINITY_DN1529_c0_g1_i2.p1 TRINITY_DN1529_c0_g1~~TRINITY_DN1529_c0_g1_i2.p1  ORF type:complete len:573 (-),score=95.33 TRINITY_DN1529_c0_g1_i2:678-2354(-)